MKFRMSRRKIMWLAITLAVVATISIAAWYAWNNRYFLHHLIYGEVVIDRRQWPVAGIDVSAHNGKINFELVAADSIDFVYIKSSEGAEFRDSMFTANVTAAQEAGLKAGAYHYFRKGVSGVRQASNLLDAVAAQHLDLPLAIDIEDYGNNNLVDDATTVSQLRDMLMALRDVGHVNVVLYTNGKGFSNFINNKGLPPYLLWLCAFKQPSEVKSKNPVLLQYSHYGKVKGMAGNVDRDVFIGSKEQWVNWLEDNKPPTMLKL